ncbi:hypothetical protein V8C86DRAFT_2508457 [Haematococcus lacustris]
MAGCLALMALLLGARRWEAWRVMGLAVGLLLTTTASRGDRVTGPLVLQGTRWWQLAPTACPSLSAGRWQGRR